MYYMPEESAQLHLMKIETRKNSLQKSPIIELKNTINKPFTAS